ncbi:tRNA (adenosine(37)-N6)-threonylcarbamoyltransferase complex dimerization subunit type 1 TsaB [Atopococcus tabaci]|uniref:tRNA (adenosine(37)-N6)-threonylcarbamoyltransferase complex dimerization subunit type 1 TsaB n=1 Tax=Atopococcus tabaci TaxID=269774 RepID=UPI0003F70246|nr:tRNA (adenosine(37)-N6)-threonylcarbamoyltransferase complex dimerization subunit type 1 TsaB [Atopococcus tabaci]
MRILAIDTSNEVMSIAVLENQTMIGELTTNVKRNHSERLMPAIDELMKDVSWQPEELDRIAIAKGPGSYTGLRIGATIAKTLAWTLQKELTGVSSLKVLAANRIPSSSYIVPLFDARRGNIYTGLYRYEAGELKQVEPDTHISAERWARHLLRLDEPVELIGQDAAKHIEIFREVLGDNVRVAPQKDHIPRASVLGWLAFDEQPLDVHTFTPDYLKLAEAEEKWRKAHPEDAGGEYVEKI